MKLLLPFPNRKLSPNTHAHWRAKESARKLAIDTGFLAALEARQAQGFERAEAYQVQIVFCQPDRRHRDLDNLHSALKHYLDGVCNALNINDRQFKQVNITLGEVRKGGAVEVDISPLPEAGGGVE